MNKFFKSALMVVTIVTTFSSCVRNDLEPVDVNDWWQKL
jgi:hypothetical protein